MPWSHWWHATGNVTISLGVLLIAALFAGILGQWLRLPKVTSYLLMGVAVGSLGWIPHEHIEQIKPLTKLAIALVLFTLGCHFPLTKVRQIVGRVLRLSAGELSLTFGLILLGLPLLGASWTAALLLAALALETAPATTILVLKETESEGPVTRYANALVATNNLAAIILFEFLFLIVVFAYGKLQTSPWIQLRQLGWDLIGSVLIGIVAGLAVSYCFGLVVEARRLVLLLAMILLVLGICLGLEIPYLLAFLAMGATVANSSYQTRQVLAELDRVTGLLAVVFFVTHGTELQLDKLPQVGLVGMGYLGLRSFGKYFGVRWAAQASREESSVRRWQGATLIAQAGSALALTDMAVKRTAGLDGPLPELILDIQTIILGTVVVFEIAGPLLILQAVLRAGEVPLAQAVHHPGPSLWEQLRTVVNRIKMALGFDPWHGRSDADLTVNDLMRKKVPMIPVSATFDEVITILEHSADNTFPVVDEGKELVGVIRYRELSHALFDRALGPLVRAADVTTPAGRVLYPEEPLTRASALFAASKDDCIPVIAAESPHQLLGVVRRRDVLRLLFREVNDSDRTP